MSNAEPRYRMLSLDVDCQPNRRLYHRSRTTDRPKMNPKEPDVQHCSTKVNQSRTLPLSPAEYERRKAFCEEIKGMNRSEAIEIARILRSHNVPISENRSGIFFDMAKLPEGAFDALLKFRSFVAQNNKELEKRTQVRTT